MKYLILVSVMVGLLISAFIKGATDAEIGMLSFIDRNR